MGEVRRTCSFFSVGLLSLLLPIIDEFLSITVASLTTAAIFGIIAIIVSTLNRVNQTGRYRVQKSGAKYYGLTGFAISAGAISLLVPFTSLTSSAFVLAVFVITSGMIGSAVLIKYRTDPTLITSGFITAGTIGGVGAAYVTHIGSEPTFTPAGMLFIAASAAILGALIRSILVVRDDAVVVLAVGILVWFLVWLEGAPGLDKVGIGITAAVALGIAAYVIGTASVTGTLTGILLALFAVVLGGYGWFVLLITFFALGSLSSKFKYDLKQERGMAEDNDGARRGANVLANSAVALVAVVSFAASDQIGLSSGIFLYAFAGAVGAALADTFSSEFGGLFEDPRLITTLEPVPPGTDGAVTIPGIAAGFCGASIIALLAAEFFSLSILSALIILIAGFLGTIVDSILGAIFEGDVLDNQSVNLIATFVAAIVAGGLSFLV